MKTLLVLLSTIFITAPALAGSLTATEVASMFKTNIKHATALVSDETAIRTIACPIAPDSITARRSYDPTHWLAFTADQNEYFGDLFVVNFQCTSNLGYPFAAKVVVYVSWTESTDGSIAYEMKLPEFIQLKSMTDGMNNEQGYIANSLFPITWTKK